MAKKGTIKYREYLIVPRDNLWAIYSPDDVLLMTTLTKLGAKAYINKHIKGKTK